MIIARFGIDTIPFDGNSAVTVGTFDGVHCGHQGIIRRMRKAVEAEASRIVVVTFDPHPQIVLQKPGKPPVQLLTTVDERCEVLEKQGVDLVVVIPFSREFAATPAERFVTGVIVETIGVKHFFIGHDHKFGKDRGGDEALLKELAPRYGFDVEWIEPLECDHVVVSSTRIRAALNDGDVVGAARMLGRPYGLTGRVIRGDGRGRELGIPTANLKPLDEHKLVPGNGVYVVTAEIDGRTVVGMANIGIRPTFTTDTERSVEVHFLDLDQDLYDRNVTVTFRQFLRKEQTFASKEAFLEQLAQDRQQTTNFQTTL